jgi:D-3-phosphoglycerate dehydrogenase
MTNSCIMVLGQLHTAALSALGNLGEICFFTKPADLSFAEYFPNVRVLIFRSPFVVDKKLLGCVPNLRHVIRAGSGIEGVDTPLLSKHGIELHVIQADGSAVAELVVGLLICKIREIERGARSLREGRWEKRLLVGRQIANSTVLVVGYGRIGRKVAGLLSSLGARILAQDRSPTESEKQAAAAECGVDFVALDDGLCDADYIIICCPLTAETRGLFDAARFQRMRRHSILINVARAAVVDTAALIEALDSGAIGGACIDVFESEPVLDSPLAAHSKILATPHIGAQTYEAHLDIGARVASLTGRLLHG